jgi:cell division septation protein DedD
MNKLRLMILGIAMIGMSQFCFSQSINVTRKMPSSAAPGSEFTVELTVNKGSTSGFAKLQEEIPDGFTASAIESKSATFTFDKSKVKFIWMSLPADGSYTVSYKVKVDAAASGSKTITGTFSYIDGNDTKKISIASSSIDLSGAVSSSTSSSTTSTTSSTNTTTDNTPPPVKETPPPVVVKTPEPTSAPPAPEPKKVIPPPVVKPRVTPPATPNNVSGIVFRVQIGAGQNSGAEGDLKSKYNIAEEVYSEQIDGLYKYTAGSFTSYGAAKDYRDKVRSSGDDGAFIVAYQNGARMSLQDALNNSGH